jgi:hypothetical protein
MAYDVERDILIKALTDEKASLTKSNEKIPRLDAAIIILQNAQSREDLAECIKGLIASLYTLNAGYQIGGIQPPDYIKEILNNAASFSDEQIISELNKEQFKGISDAIKMSKLFEYFDPEAKRRKKIGQGIQLDFSDQQELNSIVSLVQKSETDPSVHSKLIGQSSRISDIAKLKKTNKKPISKNAERFIKSDAPRFGGIMSFGPHVKKSEKERESKIYYVGPHNLNEYFPTELLNFIGLTVPKFRIMDDDSHATQSSASQQIEGYIPMKVFFSEPDSFQEPSLKEMASKYEFDFQNQIIKDRTSGEIYRLGGNFFGADLGAELIQDRDFQPDGFNFGLILKGNKFYAIAIDKDLWTPSFRSSYEDIKKNVDHRIAQSPIFKVKTEDQVLALVENFSKLITPINGSLAPIHYIFFNSRVQSEVQKGTFSNEKLYVAMNNIINNAEIIINHYLEQYGVDALARFIERESIRSQLVDKAIEMMDTVPSEEIKAQIKADLMEDLRGVYYHNLLADQSEFHISAIDLNSNQLIQALSRDANTYHARSEPHRLPKMG